MSTRTRSLWAGSRPGRATCSLNTLWRYRGPCYSTGGITYKAAVTVHTGDHRISLFSVDSCHHLSGQISQACVEPAASGGHPFLPRRHQLEVVPVGARVADPDRLDGGAITPRSWEAQTSPTPRSGYLATWRCHQGERSTLMVSAVSPRRGPYCHSLGFGGSFVGCGNGRRSPNRGNSLD
jgi:hypothetical protein